MAGLGVKLGFPVDLKEEQYFICLFNGVQMLLSISVVDISAFFQLLCVKRGS